MKTLNQRELDILQEYIDQMRTEVGFQWNKFTKPTDRRKRLGERSQEILGGMERILGLSKRERFLPRG